MERRSTLQLRDSLGHRDVKTESISSKRWRARLVRKDRDGGIGGSGVWARDDVQQLNAALDDADLSSDDGIDSGIDSGIESGDDIDSDFEDDVPPPFPLLPPPPPPPPETTAQLEAASTSGSIVTLTARPPSQVTPQVGAMTTLTPATPAPSPLVPIKLPASPTTTTAPIINIPTGLPANEMKGEDGGSSTVLSLVTSIQPSATSTSIEKIAESTSAIEQQPTRDFSMDDDDMDDKHKWRMDQGPPRGLDPAAEHLLIAAGAIGAFILFCFIGWVVYRVMKRSKGGPGFGGNRGLGFIDKLSWRRKEPMEGTWDGRTLYMTNEAPPIYEKGGFGTGSMQTFYGPGKAYPSAPGSVVRSVAPGSETGTLRLNDNPALAGIIDQYQPGNEGTMNNGNIYLTLRSQMSQPYFTESEVARQQPVANNPVRAPGTRASQLSSISSGFGDGDIIIPPPLAVSKPLPTPNTEEDDPIEDKPTTDKPGSRDSWVSRDGGRRETVYTTTSEDRPARFRSIGSWVNQQAGRTKRAGSRARERGEIPVMPAIPGEINMLRGTAYR